MLTWWSGLVAWKSGNWWFCEFGTNLKISNPIHTNLRAHLKKQYHSLLIIEILSTWENKFNIIYFTSSFTLLLTIYTFLFYLLVSYFCQPWHGVFLKLTSNLTVSSIESPSELPQLHHMREPVAVDTGASNTSMNPTSNPHGTSIKPAPVRLPERAHNCRYGGVQKLHETYIKPPCILHGTSIKNASKMFNR